MVLTQEQVVDKLKAMKERTINKEDESFLDTLLTLVESVGWCDTHGKPLAPLGMMPCDDCASASHDVLASFEAEHGVDNS